MLLPLKVIYSLFFGVYFLIALAFSAAYGRVFSLFSKDPKEFMFNVARFWSRRLALPLIARVKVNGLNNIPGKTPVIFVSNHQSNFDIPLIIGYLPGSFRFIVKQEYFKTPIIGPYTRWSGHLSIDRKVGTEAMKTLKMAAELVESGKSIIIFPEGTRSSDGKLGRFKRGGFALAFETGIPIVPLAISGTYKIMKRGSFLLWPGKVTLNVGKPIHIKAGKPNKEIYRSTTEFVRQKIEEMMVKEEV